MLRTHNQPAAIRIFFVINIFIGASTGAYFSWEVSVYCGSILLGVAIAGFVFALINALLLVTKQRLTRNLVILCGLLTLGTLALPLASIKQVDDASLCGWQFCLGQGVDNQDFIQQFKSQDTNYNSTTCSNLSNSNITALLVIFYALQEKKNISNNEIWNISEGLPMTGLAALAFFSLLTFVLFAIFVWKHRKDRGERLLP